MSARNNVKAQVTRRLVSELQRRDAALTIAEIITALELDPTFEDRGAVASALHKLVAKGLVRCDETRGVSVTMPHGQVIERQVRAYAWVRNPLPVRQSQVVDPFRQLGVWRLK